MSAPTCHHTHLATIGLTGQEWLDHALLLRLTHILTVAYEHSVSNRGGLQDAALLTER